MSDTSIDILMITYNRPEYTRLSLERLLDTCDGEARVWVWHNGMHEETLEIARSFQTHPRFHRFHHSLENVCLTEPTNWLWSESSGAYLSKVDDDCLVPENWLSVLRQAHCDIPKLGVVGCWRFPNEDFDEALSRKKIVSYGQHQLLQNCWVEGSGYLMKRECVDQQGLLKERQSFTSYCIHLAAKGWVNGWYYPFLYQEHMDDPRAEHSLLKSDADLEAFLPLSAKRNGIATLDEWTAQLKRSARICQSASTNPHDYLGWRGRVRRQTRRVWAKIAGQKGEW